MSSLVELAKKLLELDEERGQVFAIVHNGVSTNPIRTLCEGVVEMERVLLERAKLVHHGQYHQWREFEKCDHELCVEVRRILQGERTT